jgi:hypothetical protein
MGRAIRPIYGYQQHGIGLLARAPARKSGDYRVVALCVDDKLDLILVKDLISQTGE